MIFQRQIILFAQIEFIFRTQADRLAHQAGKVVGLGGIFHIDGTQVGLLAAVAGGYHAVVFQQRRVTVVQRFGGVLSHRVGAR